MTTSTGKDNQELLLLQKGWHRKGWTGSAPTVEALACMHTPQGVLSKLASAQSQDAPSALGHCAVHLPQPDSNQHQIPY
jgi:hypothetical protein